MNFVIIIVTWRIKLRLSRDDIGFASSYNEQRYHHNTIAFKHLWPIRLTVCLADGSSRQTQKFDYTVMLFKHESSQLF